MTRKKYAVLKLVLSIIGCYSMYCLITKSKKAYSYKFKHLENIQCGNITIPDINNIEKINKIWQYVSYNKTKAFFLAAYFDDREQKPCLRAFPTMTSPLGELPERKDLNALLWYNNMRHPISVPCNFSQYGSAKFWHGDGMSHATGTIKCILPDAKELPVHVSFVVNRCDKPTMLLDVIIPQPAKENKTEITACVKTLFGNLTKDNVTYIVSWFEALRMLGLPEIFMSYDLKFMDKYISKVFKYYEDIQFLNMRHMPNNLFQTNVPTITDGFAQTVHMSISNDCFYRNIKKYRYIIHQDIDELLVPRKHNTYKSLVTNYLIKNQKYTNATALAAMTTHFYTFIRSPNSSLTNGVPILQHNLRLPEEIEGVTPAIGSGPVKKSFQNTDTCARFHIHVCGGAIDGHINYGHVFKGEDILVHHYRHSCKNSQKGAHPCPNNNSRLLVDNILLDKFGKELQQRVFEVFHKIGYH